MKPFLLSYGGGHANIQIRLSRSLTQLGIKHDLLGLTTAYAAFRAAGLKALDITALLRPDDADYSDRVAPYVPETVHPDITPEQTQAYFSLGFRSLAEQIGEDEALERVAAQGRMAFEPVSIFRRHFADQPPSVVVATTSPRFEVAAIRAARALNIPTVAIGDHFLAGQLGHVGSEDFADHLVVFGERVAEYLEPKCSPGMTFHPLGNPAFDDLAAIENRDAVRQRLRDTLGFGDRTVILWPLSAEYLTIKGRPMMTGEEAVAFFDDLCEADPSLTYVMRPHPNGNSETLQPRHGVLDTEHALEEVLLAADVVVSQTSTVGLQAALMGVPNIVLDFAFHMPSARAGYGIECNDRAELARRLLARDYAPCAPELRATVGGAGDRIAKLVRDLHEKKSESADTSVGGPA